MTASELPPILPLAAYGLGSVLSELLCQKQVGAPSLTNT